jgi:hypothetical protein
MKGNRYLIKPRIKPVPETDMKDKCAPAFYVLLSESIIPSDVKDPNAWIALL